MFVSCILGRVRSINLYIEYTYSGEGGGDVFVFVFCWIVLHVLFVAYVMGTFWHAKTFHLLQY